MWLHTRPGTFPPDAGVGMNHYPDYESEYRMPSEFAWYGKYHAIVDVTLFILGMMVIAVMIVVLNLNPWASTAVGLAFRLMFIPSERRMHIRLREIKHEEQRNVR